MKKRRLSLLPRWFFFVLCALSKFLFVLRTSNTSLLLKFVIKDYIVLSTIKIKANNRLSAFCKR